MISVYFLCLLADGRKLEERLLRARVPSGADEGERELPLIAAEYAAWTAHPLSGSKTPASLGLTDARGSGTDGAFS
ncbi:MAG: hypothetical protein ABFD52_05535 [Acidobacteriota bacterium]